MPDSLPYPGYVFQPYPAYRFHATLPARVVATAEEDAALGAGWVDTPAKLLSVPAPVVEPVAEPVAEPKRSHHRPPVVPK